MNSTYTAIQNLKSDLRTSHRLLQQEADRLSSEMSYVGSRLANVDNQMSELEFDLDQEVPLTDHVSAFSRARDVVRMYCKESPESFLEISILAVSSSFSWPFVSDFLPQILKQYPNFNIRLKWLLVHPESLSESGTNARGERWDSLSRRRESELASALEILPDEISCRYKVNLSYYANIPHWHGVLLADTELILGRTTWNWEDSVPNLRVGENDYRIFTVLSPTKGQRRIDLFKDWFRYYTIKAKGL